MHASMGDPYLFQDLHMVKLKVIIHFYTQMLDHPQSLPREMWSTAQAKKP